MPWPPPVIELKNIRNRNFGTAGFWCCLSKDRETKLSLLDATLYTTSHPIPLTSATILIVVVALSCQRQPPHSAKVQPHPPRDRESPERSSHTYNKKDQSHGKARNGLWDWRCAITELSYSAPVQNSPIFKRIYARLGQSFTEPTNHWESYTLAGYPSVGTKWQDPRSFAQVSWGRFPWSLNLSYWYRVDPHWSLKNLRYNRPARPRSPICERSFTATYASRTSWGGASGTAPSHIVKSCKHRRSRISLSKSESLARFIGQGTAASAWRSKCQRRWRGWWGTSAQWRQ